ncbi:hypothetical protein [Agromyces sp. SYSU T00194]|uniref:hypothetical protein n=1 Tax=Agromyces chitinivorans TaxID=3158560 RepID=UPI00339B0587
MPAPRTRQLVALAIALGLALTGCMAVDATPPTPTATDAPEPVFASDDEALAAAVEAYEAYTLLSSMVSASPDDGAQPMGTAATETHLRELEASLSGMAANGLRTTGAAEVRNYQLAERSIGDGTESLLLYLCLDVGGYRLHNFEGLDVTPADRDEISTLLVGMITDADGNLLVDTSELWSGDSVC